MSRVTGVTLAVLLVTLAVGTQGLNEEEVRHLRLLKRVQDPTQYDAKIPPHIMDKTTGKHLPANVQIQLSVHSLDSVNEKSMDYSVSFFLRQKWRDPRLCFLASCNSSAAAGDKADEELKKLELDASIMSQIWQPDTYFTNERTASTHKITVENRMTHLFTDGTVVYSMRLSMTLTCHMELSKYPFDQQECPLKISSYGYTKDVVTYDWMPRHVIVKEVELPTFELVSWEKTKCMDIEEYEVGNFSCISMAFGLNRSYGYYLAQVYVPTFLVIILSWLNFWLTAEAVPARISVGLLTVLTMSTQSSGARSHLPHVSYVKAIDVWFMVCLLFVFAALVEFAYVNVQWRVYKRRMAEQEKSGGEDFSAGRDKARMCDKISRFAFPGVFLVFNIFYWCYYLL